MRASELGCQVTKPSTRGNNSEDDALQMESAAESDTNHRTCRRLKARYSEQIRTLESLPFVQCCFS